MPIPRNRDPAVLALFPGLKAHETGQTADDLWASAVAPVHAAWWDAHDKARQAGKTAGEAITVAYEYIEATFGGFTLRGFFEKVAGWSEGAISLYDLANAHVVMSNGFVESWKDSFLSSQAGGKLTNMHQLKSGMEAIPLAVVDPSRPGSLAQDVRFGARVVSVSYNKDEDPAIDVTYEVGGVEHHTHGDYVVFGVPFPALNLIPVAPEFTTAKRTAIRTTRYVEVTKILLQFRTRWWETYLTSRNAGTDGGMVTDLPVGYLKFPAKGSAQFTGDQQRGVVMASYVFEQDATGLAAMSEERRNNLAADNLRKVFGASVIDESIEVGASQRWSEAELQGGSAFAYFGPGQKHRMFATILAPDWDGRAHFAGEHASYSHGWIEGALKSALRVAYQIHESVAS